MKATCSLCGCKDAVVDAGEACLECRVERCDYCGCDIFKEGPYECFDKVQSDAVLVVGYFVNKDHLPQAVACAAQRSRS